jgi:hypothetical protein
VTELVTSDNPSGSINNTQFELAGSIAHNNVLQQSVNCAGWTIIPMGDNTAAMAWQHKGSATTSSRTAYLLQVSSLHQWHYRYLSKADYIARPLNQMADDCLRLWHLYNSQLLAYFNCKYPQK